LSDAEVRRIRQALAEARVMREGAELALAA
jgi:hypothetical protein